ncbi:hypothetical protein [Kineococcus xinjiangensis]|uniref:hypothetical protein n=1 Tax=Kineococcus xinjiangensis TaxID=512762 RepID=UPI000CEBEA02|nr:hypothetical protein [Kineococcus xinjiangensis]
MDDTGGPRLQARWSSYERRLTVAVAVLALGCFVSVYVVDPVLSVHPDLWRLYSTMGALDSTANVVAGVVWLRGICSLTLAGFLASWAGLRWAGRRPRLAAAVRLTAAVAVLGAVAASTMAANVFVGTGFYLHAEDLGIAPPGGSTSALVQVTALVGVCMVGLAAVAGSACLVAGLGGPRWFRRRTAGRS